MRILFILVLILAVNSFSIDEIVHALSVHFPDDIWNKELQADQADVCKTYLRSNERNELFACSKETCQSILDSNIFIRYYNEINVFEYYEITGAKRSIAEVLKDELQHYNECMFLTLNKAEMDTLFYLIDSQLSPKLDSAGLLSFGYEACFKGNRKCVSEVVGSPVNGSDLVDSILNARNAILFVPATKAERVFSINNDGVLVVPDQLKGKKYAILNLQGILIQEGILEGSITIPSGCTIFHIREMKKNFLLKN